MQKTLILLKPDCVQRELIGEVITRIERRGLKIVAMKMLRITPDLAKRHYAEHRDKPFYVGLEEFITSAPVLAMVVAGPEAIRLCREMIGATDCRVAMPGTIRGDFGISRQRNLVHGSDGEESAAREIELYFADTEIIDYESAIVSWLVAPDESS